MPALVELADIRGDLQMHTDATDGKHTLAEMVEACQGLDYEYIAITDHTKAVRVAGGLTKAGFHKQAHAIDAIRKRVSTLFVFKGAEVDVLDDGSLDLDDETLAALDVVLVSVHSKFNMSKAEMTRRIIRALQHPRVHILGHPTGRLLGKREPYPVDMSEIIKVARDHHVMLEVNAQPDRLDLNDMYIQMAREAGVKVVLNTDAHRTQELGCMRYGVDQARRGWCEAKDVANTSHVTVFRTLLRKWSGGRCRMTREKHSDAPKTPVAVPIDGQSLPGDLGMPPDPQGIVLFAHGSGSSRHSPRNQFVARTLERRKLATLLIDLLTPEEEVVDDRTAEYRFDIPMLAGRLVTIVDWLRGRQDTAPLPIGLFGASTGGGAALIAASGRPREIAAVVSRGGRPDLAGAALSKVTTPTLLIVGGFDAPVIQMNRDAMKQMRGQVKLEIVPGATHLFEEPGTLERVAELAGSWFAQHLHPAIATRRG